MIRLYDGLNQEFDDQIESWKQKIKNPNDIDAKIKKLEDEQAEILNRIVRGTADIQYFYSGDEEGKIKKIADDVVSRYKEKINGLNPNEVGSIDHLKSFSVDTLEEYMQISQSIQREVIEACNNLLKSISNNNDLVGFIQPDYESIDFKEIEKLSKSNSEERRKIKEAGTFTDAEYISVFSQNLYFKNFSNNIEERLNSIKNELVEDLMEFVSNSIEMYKAELKFNARNKINELKEINEIKVENTVIIKYIEKIGQLYNSSKEVQVDLKAIEKGIL